MVKFSILIGLTLGLILINAGLTLGDAGDLECNKYVAQVTVHNVAVGLGEMLKNHEGEESRIELIRSFVDPIRFFPDDSGYFFVYYYNHVNIALPPQPELEGEDLSDYTDRNGKFVIRELSQVAKDGGGFVEYYWAKPGEEGDHKKISYVEPIPNSEYFIGTGVYMSE